MTRRTTATKWVMAAILGAAGLGTVQGGRTAAEDFRVDNAIFRENEKRPFIETTTLFSAGLVYDYLKAPEEETVFDKNHSRFVLLDVGRRIKTEISLDRVTALCEHLKTWAARQSDPLLSFLANPTFDEQYQAETGRLVLASPLVTYELTTVAADNPAISSQYREFCDWYCQLNTLLNPGSRPPFARLVVDGALDARQRFPQEVKLTVQMGSSFPPKRMVVRSQHRVTDRLVESDRHHIVQTEQYMAIFRPVSFDEYQKR